MSPLLALMPLASVAMNLGDSTDNTEAGYRTDIASDPKDALAHYNLGTVLMSSGDVVGAETEFRAAVKFNPNFPLAHYNLGVVCMNRGDIDAAEIEFRAGIACADPQNAALTVATHHNLAALLEDHRQDYAGAEAEYLAALLIDATKHDTRFCLANMLGDTQGRWSDAAAHMAIAADGGFSLAVSALSHFEAKAKASGALSHLKAKAVSKAAAGSAGGVGGAAAPSRSTSSRAAQASQLDQLRAEEARLKREGAWVGGVAAAIRSKKAELKTELRKRR